MCFMRHVWYTVEQHCQTYSLALLLGPKVLFIETARQKVALKEVDTKTYWFWEVKYV